MLFSLASVVALGFSATTGVHAQVFALACNLYPDICDNYSHGVLCHGIGTTLHYDSTNTQGNGDRRRVAVGCGGGNYCSGRAGIQCDEYPYASTYDGGLGCYPMGFTGAATLIQSGSTRCADGPQNGRHGQALQQFYKNQLNNQNSRALVVAYQNNNQGNRGPLGELIRTQGTRACPSDSSGDYRFRSTPATPSCPSRMRRELQGNSTSFATPEVKYLTARTESGMMIELPYHAHSHDASLFTPGKMVVTHDTNGNIVEERIVAVEGEAA
ncbi:hypothetical protein BD779DRAFT_1787985 [Infundibulicybe gibba]|nr:hypothetical protein BD779DRAFT_1787985 [Infundibulicybe gibba]